MLLQNRNVILIYAISFIDLLAIGLTFPLLYPHIRSLGASHMVVGIFGSTYSGLQVLSGPVIGSWSDLKGRRFVAVITLAISCLCYFLIGLTSSLGFIFFLRIVLGFVKHTQTLCKAIIGDVLPREKHAEVFGRSAAISSLGFVVGPIIGGHLSELSHGFSYVCTLTAVLFIINIGFIYSIPDTSKNAKNKQNNSFTIKKFGNELLRAVAELMKIDWKVYWDAFFLRFLFGFSISIYFSNQAIYIQEKFDLSQRYIGYTISFLSIIGSLAGLMLGYITNRFYKNDFNCSKRLFHGFATICITFIGLYYAPNITIFVMFLIPFGISNTILRIVSMEVILSRSGNKDRGSLSGASNSVMSVARFISPITSGIIGDTVGENAVVLSAFAPALLGSLLCVKLMYKNHVIHSKSD
ncbi:hypothetical protein ILUMI_23915 [Ignelater luminosus]|uniref:Major facilitator superfamily (MFS) profile domain-containing protein n=1 Tax=Ignelater luminosus TaxID=2038154 RepID=A0A8K0CDM6_IGNLU|nr:hypothetical protein ILUMI_23915 [Ignelater luminosus]